MSNFTEPFSTPPRLQAATLAGRFMQPQSMSNAPIIMGAQRAAASLFCPPGGRVHWNVTSRENDEIHSGSICLFGHPSCQSGFTCVIVRGGTTNRGKEMSVSETIECRVEMQSLLWKTC